MKFSKMYVFINFDNKILQYSSKISEKLRRWLFCLQLGPMSYLLVVAPLLGMGTISVVFAHLKILKFSPLFNMGNREWKYRYFSGVQIRSQVKFPREGRGGGVKSRMYTSVSPAWS